MKQQAIEEIKRILEDANNDIANLASLHIDDAYSLSELVHMFEANLKIIKALTNVLHALDDETE